MVKKKMFIISVVLTFLFVGCSDRVEDKPPTTQIERKTEETTKLVENKETKVIENYNFNVNAGYFEIVSGDTGETLKVMKDSKELDTLINILNSAKLEHLDTNDFAGWKYLIKLYDNNQNKKELKSLTLTSNELIYIKTSENNSYCKATSDLEKAISEFLN